MRLKWWEENLLDIAHDRSKLKEPIIAMIKHTKDNTAVNFSVL